MFIYNVEMKLRHIAHRIEKKLDHKLGKLRKVYEKYMPVIRALLQKFYEDHQEEIDATRDTLLGYYEDYTETAMTARLSASALLEDYRDNYCAAEENDGTDLIRTLVCSENGKMATNYLAFAISAPAFCKFKHFLKVIEYFTDAEEAKEESDKIMADVTQMVHENEEYGIALF